MKNTVSGGARGLGNQLIFPHGRTSPVLLPVALLCMPMAMPNTPAFRKTTFVVQLQHNGVQPDKTYAEAVPWLEAAAFNNFLGEREVCDTRKSPKNTFITHSC